MNTVIFYSIISFLASVWGGYKVGDQVDDFKLKNVDGKMVSLSDYKNAKGFIVVFDCNTCPYSKAYNKRIMALQVKYYDKGFPLIVINSNDPKVSPGDSYEEMQKYARKKQYQFPYLFDETQEIAKNFGATNTPYAFVLKKEGKVIKVAYIGAIDDNSRNASQVTKTYVEDAVQAVMEGEDVPVKRTKAIGCTIKWSRS